MDHENDALDQSPVSHHQTPHPYSSDKSSVVLLTGGTGFLGKHLLTRLATRPNTTIYALCRKGSVAKLKSLLDNSSQFNASVKTVLGDITLPNLGIGPDILEKLRQSSVEIFHCAAAYDLAVHRNEATRVNTEGTKNVLDLAVSLPSLRCFHHVSTIIVSGDRVGRIYENELDKGQGFKNYYEFSKFHAEKEVIRYSDRIPATIYRPAIIIGDSRDGSAEKFDGVYFGMRLMMRGLPMLIPGNGDVPLHLVPVDFVAEAISAIADFDDAIGKTFHLCDPNPESVNEITRKSKEFLQARSPILHIPVPVMRMIASLPGFSAFTKIPSQLIPYMHYETNYDMTNSLEILESAGIECPSISTYLEKNVDFFRKSLKT
jgi:thioester reductase-like protein